MKAIKIKHKNEERIKIDFPFNTQVANLIRQIPDARWSQTQRAWHIPYSKAAFGQLIHLFPEIEFERVKKEIVMPEMLPDVAEILIKSDHAKGIFIDVAGRNIILKLPKNEADIRFIRLLRYSRWDSKQYCWIVPHFPGNLELIKDYFKERITKLTVHENPDIHTKEQVYKVAKNEVLCIKTNAGRMKLIFGFNKELTFLIKKIPFYTWDSKNKWWSIPYSEIFHQQIREITDQEKLQFRYEEENHEGNKKPRQNPFEIPNYRHVPESYLLKIRELRYSESTYKTYQNAFEEFINYYNKYDIDKIDETQIIAFCRYLVIERKVSSSYQNQAINAIKFYYERVLGGQRRFYALERPIKEKSLPTVLSSEEVTGLFKKITNLKHKAILMTIYSAGLRISEATNLKVADIDSKRMQLKIAQAKGKKDRYTLLSAKTLRVLREYFTQYKPKIYLFEGQNGEKYSTRSIQQFFAELCRNTGLKKKVTVHSLRHSFATHLLENGTDLRYIQTLLGHESSKTTEIYTHITTKGFDQIKNPIDSLDF